MDKYIMAIDSGTSSCRCILFDKKGKIRSIAQKEFRQYYPQPGWVEHDAEEIWQTQYSVCRSAMEMLGITGSDIAAIGITNQRETTIVWDKNTGKPVYRAIVWQCRRTSAYCDTLTDISDEIREKTGLVPDAYFSATKLRWILENVSGARESAERGDLLFGTVDTWLIWKLAGGKVHVTDYSNASRTMIYNINTLEWDKKLLSRFGIPESMLPEVRPSSYVYGKTEQSLFGAEIPICGDAGDQQAALFGHLCFNKGDAKNTYGTGCFLLMNTGEDKIRSKNGLVSTIAWGLDGKVNYALEGSVFVAGAAIQWLRDEMKLISSAKETDEISKSVPDTNGCYVVPAFTGLGAPYWDQYARGTIVGITRGVKREHLIRATVESLAYQSNDVISAMTADSLIPLNVLRVDGGASANDFLMQFQADITGSPVQRPQNVESTASGAAYLAGLASGFWTLAELESFQSESTVFNPEMEPYRKEMLIKGWKKAVKHSLHYEDQ